MQIKIFNNYHNDENTYLLYESGTGVVIDPGNSDIEIAEFAKENTIEIKYILLTHCHYDHIEFLEKLRENDLHEEEIFHTSESEKMADYIMKNDGTVDDFYAGVKDFYDNYLKAKLD